MSQFNIRELNTIYYALVKLQQHEQAELEKGALDQDILPGALVELANRVQRANDLGSKVEDLIFSEIMSEGEIVD